ncbi:MAG: DUF2752 domain-containing protein [Dysgonamonadaceae bacterium]|jgi:hypothetical protein|nr:DUF2752 domain-containing protein [Dysgonamonadaceae bacterium]
MEIPLLPCPAKHFFHIDCPGCGLQRSILALLKGDFVESLSVYPATILIFVLLVYTALHLKFDFKQGAAIIKWGYAGCVAVIVGFYIYKMITHKLI